MIETYRQEDPPLDPQLAVPVTVTERMYAWGKSPSAPPITKAVAQLWLTLVYYLLRVGERWTKEQDGKEMRRATRTI